MDEFLEKLRAAQALRGVSAVDALSARVARALLTVFNLEKEAPDCRLSEFYERYPSFPVRLYPARCQTEPAAMFKNPFKTQLWEVYLERRNSLPKANVGIAATLGKSAIYVLHDMVTLPTPYGGSICLRHVEDLAITRFETLVQFMDSVRQIWTP